MGSRNLAPALSLVIATSLATAGCLRAQAGGVSDADPCAHATTQRELTACWSEAAAAQEDLLIRRLGQIRERIGESGRDQLGPALEDAQARWSRYRDAHCRMFAMAWEGGSGEAMARAICRHRLAAGRREELQRLLVDLGP